MNNLKTPLRYPGGKSKVCIKLEQYFPDLSNYDEFREPFLGGGGVAIHVTKKYPHLKIWVNDLYEPLYNFWNHLQKTPEPLVSRLLNLHKTSRAMNAVGLFLHCKNMINNPRVDSLDRAAAFYLVNRCSFSGGTDSAGFSKQAAEGRFTLKGIQNLSSYSELIQKWVITNSSYEELLICPLQNRVFIYLDPPYDIVTKNLYGERGSMHKSFDHDLFATKCWHSFASQLISYNSSDLVKQRFCSWNHEEFDLTYSMKSDSEYKEKQKSRKELVIFNYSHQVDR